MRSPHLKRQIATALGTAEGAAPGQWLAPLHAAGLGPIASAIERLLFAVDETYTQLAKVQRAAIRAQGFGDRLELAGDVFCEWDLSAGTIRATSEWTRRFSAGADTAVPRIDEWMASLHTDDASIVRERLEPLIQARAPLAEVEHRVRDAQGEWRWSLLRARIVARDGQGRAERLLVLHRDIGEHKRVEAALLQAKEGAEQANRARGAFLANMSHEIRTPMNAVLGMTELALDTALSDEQRGYLTMAKSSAEALLTIIDDILDLSKIEAGRIDLETVDFSIRPMLGDAIRALAVQAHRKGLEMLLDIAAEVPDRVFGDPTRLRQILGNLVGNAVKFTEHGEVAIKVDVLRRSEASLYLQFAVSDTGIGIEAQHHGQIFEAFSQADASTTRRFGGTGLGLAITNRLVRLMDGQLWLESELGKGSTFSFTVRLATGHGEGARSTEPPANLRGRRALVVDDSQAAGEVLVRMLGRLGIEADSVVAPDSVPAQLASRRKEGRPYDLVFVDADMPAPGGFALATAMTGESAGAALVMLLASHSQRQALDRCGAGVVRAHLVKPVFEDDLLDCMRSIFDPEQASQTMSMQDSVNLDQALAEANAPDRTPLEILLVEDTPVNQTLAVHLLTKAGHRVTVANNGVEAIEWFEKQHFDLILMDLQMPVMDGMEATEKIRAREMRRSWVSGSNQRLSYIVAMTAHAMDGDRERCLAAGMDEYLSKPIRRDALNSVLRQAEAHRSAPPADFTEMLHNWDH